MTSDLDGGAASINESAEITPGDFIWLHFFVGLYTAFTSSTTTNRRGKKPRLELPTTTTHSFHLIKDPGCVLGRSLYRTYSRLVHFSSAFLMGITLDIQPFPMQVTPEMCSDDFMSLSSENI